ncbi:histidine decarboxylase-like isoform X2 [Physella acuta]|uniref:histidine decarboxylase-like isoform X2 n=1 Tax=Physella acuta TaxID=109671 RepID=UPI0027DBEC4F|nr:histidine decarboxylase-like isoform X2 [Physella acuta]
MKLTCAKQLVDYISEYLQTIRQRRVFPDVKPGYMQQLVPDTAPDLPESWEDIFNDIERVIMPGITHWQSPYMHAYFPALTSFPSLLGDMLANAISSLGFTWASSPACTELETIVMDWLGKMIGLPACFLHSHQNHKGMGGGCIQTTASDCTFVTLLAARTEAIRRYKDVEPDLDDAEINGRLIGYCSDQAHSSVEKAGLIGLVKMRFLHSDDHLSLRGDTLMEAIRADREKGLIPFYVCATLGTTGACAFDNLKEIGPVCEAERVWLHIDAAYAGSAFICPEYREYMSGIELVDSFAFNPSKWLMVHFDCSAMWVKDARALHRTFNVEPLYLQHENSGAAIDYMHWQIALSRRFRSLKLWFVLRSFGVKGLQQHIRRGIDLAKKFEQLVAEDPRFEVAARRILGMVVFRIAGANELTEDLLKRLNKQGKVHMVPASLKGKYVIRFTVTSQFTTEADIERDWRIITSMAGVVLDESLAAEDEGIEENDEDEEDEEEMRLKVKSGAREVKVIRDESSVKKHTAVHISIGPKVTGPRRRDFGISLLLSNVPMSPKVVNGSFAALFDSSNLGLEQLARQLIVGGEFIRLSPRRRGRLGDHEKQMSLDYSVLSNRKDNPFRMRMMGSLDSKIDDILEFGSKSTQTDERKNTFRVTSLKETSHEDEGNIDDVRNDVKTNSQRENRIQAQEHWDTGHGQPDLAVTKGQSDLPVTNGQPDLPVTNGQSDLPVTNGQPDLPVTNGQSDLPVIKGDLPVTKGQPDLPVTKPATADAQVDRASTESKKTSKGGGLLQMSKAVCSKVKGVFLTFPVGQTPTPPTPPSSLDYAINGHCKYCGHLLSCDLIGRDNSQT